MWKLRNYVVFVFVGLFIVANDSVGAQSKGVAQPANAIILYGANWCAPCLAELRDLPALAAAAPAQLMIAWRDGAPHRIWPSWPDNVLIVSASDADRMAGGGDLSAGLPYTVLLDQKGKRCAIWDGKMTTERIARLKARCAARD